MEKLKCILCNENFNSKSGVARHIRHKHQGVDMSKYWDAYYPAQLCKCGCGEHTPITRGNVRAEFVTGHNLKSLAKERIGVKRPRDVVDKITNSRKGFKQSDEAKLKISQAQEKIWTEERRIEASIRAKGENHPNWQGGRHREGMYKGNLKEQVEACRERDKNTCQMCGQTKEDNRRNMDVHHINPYLDSQDNSLDNIVCLCRKCHPIADRNNLSKEEILNYYK
jgi:predicted restriction endonuclease